MSEYDLPEETYRVFPNASNHRNVYTAANGVRKAVGYRRSVQERFEQRGWRTPSEIRVFRAKTEWVDVTDEFVKS